MGGCYSGDSAQRPVGLDGATKWPITIPKQLTGSKTLIGQSVTKFSEFCVYETQRNCPKKMLARVETSGTKQ